MRLKLKEHSRHYYLGMAAFSLRRNDFKEVHLNMQVVERLQIEIDDLMKTIMMSNYIAPVLERMW